MASTNSSFDLSFQHSDVEAKIVASLERLSEVFRVLLWKAAKGRDVSPLQIQLLIYLWAHPSECGRIGELARRFDLATPTVSDAVGTLVEKGFVEKRPDPRDRRARVLTLTDAGEEVTEQLSGWAGPVRTALSDVPEDDKSVVLNALVRMIASLERQDVITRARMCRTCRFFSENAHDNSNAPHHCNLLDLPLLPDDLRVDCPEHEPTTVDS